MMSPWVLLIISSDNDDDLFDDFTVKGQDDDNSISIFTGLQEI